MFNGMDYRQQYQDFERRFAKHREPVVLSYSGQRLKARLRRRFSQLACGVRHIGAPTALRGCELPA